MSNAVIEAVVGLKVRIGSVPFGVRVSLWSGICQEMMCSIRADVYMPLYRWAHSYQCICVQSRVKCFQMSVKAHWLNGVLLYNKWFISCYISPSWFLAFVRGVASSRTNRRQGTCQTHILPTATTEAGRSFEKFNSNKPDAKRRWHTTLRKDTWKTIPNTWER